jgi:glyoxylase-like metal-dependent hydrolase (beta-lactamase superfamily II)
MVNAYQSVRILRDHLPDILLPSMGEPIMESPDEALGALAESLRRVANVRGESRKKLRAIDSPDLIRVTDHIWRCSVSQSYNWFLISESGKALVIDYGYDSAGTAFPGYSSPPHRRALLHGLGPLRDRFGIDRIDVVLVSHFHDDHVCGIPVLQRLFGTECWAAENFADLIEHPEAHCFPCNWPVPIQVDRRIALDETVQWEEYNFHFAAMSGHTRFASLIGFEADGMRFAHTGDQYFFNGDGPFSERTRIHNYVYRNGALLEGFEESGRWLLDWRPDVVLQGHWDPFFTDEDFYAHIEAWIDDYREVHESIMPLGPEETHFNLDSWGGWIWPYRVHLKEPDTVKVTVTVRNPFPREAKLDLRLVGPKGWVGSAVTLDAPPRAEVQAEMEITPNASCRRQPFAIDLTADGRPFGQVAEALLTVGGVRW